MQTEEFEADLFYLFIYLFPKNSAVIDNSALGTSLMTPWSPWESATVANLHGLMKALSVAQFLLKDSTNTSIHPESRLVKK